MKLLRLPGCLCHCVGHAGMLPTVHGDAANTTEQGTERPEEPLFLHEKMALHAACADVQLSDDKVPVAGVGSQTDDVFVGMVLRYFSCPAPMLV